MDIKKLDQLFDEAVGRIEKKESVADVSEMGPLASDHMLLEKSWGYFRQRIKRIEDQYHDLFQTKDDNIKALQKSLRLAQERNEKLQTLLNEKKEYEESLTKARIKDQFEFRKESGHLRETWEEERIRLEETIRDMEFQLARAKKEIKEVQTPFIERQRSLLRQLQQVQQQRQEQMIQAQDKETDFLTKLKELEEVCLGQQQKLDLMRTEIEARTDHVQSLSLQKMQLEKQVASQNADLLDLKEKSLKQAKEIDHLKDTMDLLIREKKGIQTAWEQEQAQWRELWDRERALRNQEKKG